MPPEIPLLIEGFIHRRVSLNAFEADRACGRDYQPVSVAFVWEYYRFSGNAPQHRSCEHSCIEIRNERAAAARGIVSGEILLRSNHSECTSVIAGKRVRYKSDDYGCTLHRKT